MSAVTVTADSISTVGTEGSRPGAGMVVILVVADMAVDSTIMVSNTVVCRAAELMFMVVETVVVVVVDSANRTITEA